MKSQVATHAGASIAVCRVFAEAIHVLYDIIWVYGAAPRRLRVGSKRIRALKMEAGHHQGGFEEALSARRSGGSGRSIGACRRL